MFSAATRDRALRDRWERIIQHITNGLTVSEIAEREGVEEDYAKALRKEVAATEGLSIWQPALTPEQRSLKVPFGLGKGSNKLRGRLGSVLYRLTDIDNHHPIDVAAKIGVHQKGQKNSKGNPSSHDWKLSQIERLAEMEGKSFEDFMRELLRI